MNQNSLQRSNRLEILAKEFWRKQLAGYTQACNLRPDSEITSVYQEEFHNFTLPVEDYTKLLQITRGSLLPAFVFLLECLKITLYKLTGEQDISIATPVFNKVSSDGNEWVLLRTQVNGALTVEELLQTVKQIVTEGYQHQYYSMETALRDEGLKEYEQSDHFLMRMEGLHRFENIEAETKKDKINDWVLTAKQESQRLELKVSYNAARYMRGTVEAVFNCYLTILSQILHQPQILIRDINLVNKEEEGKLLHAFNQTEQSYPQKRMEVLFEEQATKTPNSVALRFVSFTKHEVRTITYRELNEKANRLAGKMKESGLESGDIVGIYGDRTIENVLSMLAVLKAGGCFLSLDPSLPEDRLQFMVEDSGLKIMVLCKPLKHELVYSGSTLKVDSAEELEDCAQTVHQTGSTQDLAYVIYTSGTTGKPKGVLIEHRSMVNVVYGRVKLYQFNEGDIVLQIPSFSFDCSITDIFTPLVSGGSIVLLDEENRSNIRFIKQALTDYSITHMFNTPSFYRVLLREIGEGLNGMRIITIAGEDYEEDLVEEHQRLVPNVRLVAEYGPTETTVYCSMHEFQLGKTKVLIGKPTSNVQCLIINHEYNLLPVGLPGELYVSGVGLARGYLNRPELTDRSFIPKLNQPDQRMYKTGDRVKWTQDGSMEFLSRVDDQVKIRGQRIELGEVEAIMKKIPAVNERAVVFKTDKQGNPYLAAYYTVYEEIEAERVRKYLAQKLPTYAVPAVIRKLDFFQLNINGKLDKKALLAIDDEEAVEIIPPENETEERLVIMWTEVLVLPADQISVVQNFFDLGGNSLHAIIFIDKIAKSFGLSISLQTFLELSTVRKIAAYILEMEE